MRATDDVDVICDVAGYAAYQALAERLRVRELAEVMDEPVICRWRHGGSGRTSGSGRNEARGLAGQRRRRRPASLDVHDIVVLIDGRLELIDELTAQPDDLRAYVMRELAALREADYFEYVVQAAVAGYGDVADERFAIVSRRIDIILTELAGG